MKLKTSEMPGEGGGGKSELTLPVRETSFTGLCAKFRPAFYSDGRLPETVLPNSQLLLIVRLL